MSTKAGALLWNRKRTILVGPGDLGPGLTDVDTLLQQQNRAFEPGDPPDDGTVLPSRIMVIPMAPTANWANITHDEPFLDPVTGTIHSLPPHLFWFSLHPCRPKLARSSGTVCVSSSTLA